MAGLRVLSANWLIVSRRATRSIIRVRLWGYLLLLAGCGAEEAAPAPALHVPRWAFAPWISKDISDGPDTRAFLAGFEARDIPVGVVVLDSPWDKNYTTFQVNEDRYNDFAAMLQDFRGRGVRVVLWTTQMLNEQSFDVEDGGDTYPDAAPTYRTAQKNGWLVNGGETYFWWKGIGGGLDFYNPEARSWWRGLQTPLLDMGVAGWKLDFGDSYIPTATVATAAGIVTHQEYSESYYRDFWEHGLERKGSEEFLTMVRGWDESYHHKGRFYARPEHAPVVWAGDNRRDWVGLADALHHILKSAAAGYDVVGSDIGGYLDRDDKRLTDLVPFDLETFHRWTMVGALNPFMQLHGRANLAPWTLPGDAEANIKIYRDWSWFHQALIPFYYSLAENHQAGGMPTIRPVGAEADWAQDYRYLLGEAFLVAPLLGAGGVRDIPLPAGEWFNWWDPASSSLTGLLTDFSVGPDQLPLFIRAGAIVPLQVDRPVLGLPVLEDPTPVILVQPGPAQQLIYHHQNGPIELSADGARITLSAVPEATVIWFRGASGVAFIGETALPAGEAGPQGYWPTAAGTLVRVEPQGGVTVHLR